MYKWYCLNCVEHQAKSTRLIIIRKSACRCKFVINNCNKCIEGVPPFAHRYLENFIGSTLNGDNFAKFNAQQYWVFKFKITSIIVLKHKKIFYFFKGTNKTFNI